MRESGLHLAAILTNRLDGDGPLYRQLSTALRRAVDAGEIPLGTALPPERTLARALAVSRSTVVAAYDALKAEGWLSSRQGSGTWVRQPDPAAESTDVGSATVQLFGRQASTTTGPVVPGDPARRRGDGAPSSRADDEVIELTVAAVPGNPAVADVLTSLTNDDLAPLLASHGYVPGGLALLRGDVAAHLDSRGVPTTAEQVLVSTGSHQGIALVARQVVHPGDTVLVESPTFPGALDLFRSLGARMVPVPIDAGGARVDVLADLVARTSPHLIYVSPTFQNPTGTVMSQQRREAVAGLAAESHVPLIEDLSLMDVDLDATPSPPPPVASLESVAGASIFSVGSMSKLFWGGLRIGWVRGTESAIGRLLATKTVADMGSPLVSQLVAARLLERVDEVVAQRRAELLPRRDRMVAALAEHLPSWELTTPAGGLSLWVTLPHGNAEEFTEVALRHGVAIVPGPALSVDEGNRRCVRLVFTHPPDVLERGVERLSAAWQAYAPSSTRAVSRLLV